MAQAYGKDLASIHDVGHGEFATRSAPWLLKTLAKSGIPEGRVVDLGCGSGRWAAQLARAGYDVLGVDLSPAMIALARRRVPGAKFVARSFLSVKLPPCDAVTSLGECFSYRFDKRSGKPALFRLFRNVHAALRCDGLFLFDLLTTGLAQSSEPPLGHRTGKDWAVLVRREYDASGTNLTRWITSFRKVGSHYRRSGEVHRLRLYDSAEVIDELRRLGFRVRRLRGYGTQRFARGHVGFLARRV